MSNIQSNQKPKSAIQTLLFLNYHTRSFILEKKKRKQMEGKRKNRKKKKRKKTNKTGMTSCEELNCCTTP